VLHQSVIVEQNVTDELKEAAAHHIVDMVSHGELRVNVTPRFRSVVWKHSGATDRQRQTAD